MASGSLFLAAAWAFALGLSSVDSAAACPADPSAAPDVLLSVRFASDPPVRLGLRELATLAERRLAQRRTVTGAGSAPSVEQSIAYSGVLLRDVIASLPGYEKQGRGQRWLMFEAVATDGYRALFSWGELFNSDSAEQVLVIRAQDGQALSSAEGPLALRALGDLRPGPRHVRNLCAIFAYPPVFPTGARNE